MILIPKIRGNLAPALKLQRHAVGDGAWLKKGCCYRILSADLRSSMSFLMNRAAKMADNTATAQMM